MAGPRVTVTDPKDRAFRDDLMQVISKSIAGGFSSAEIILTIIDLAEVCAEGAVLAMNDDKKPEARRLLAKAFQDITDRIAVFEPDPTVEARIKAEGKSAWDNALKKEVVN